MEYFQRTFSTGYINTLGNPDISPSQSSAIVSILSAGTFFGALSAAPVADRLGRRLGLVFACAVFSLGVALQTATTAIPMMLAGRFFAGFGVGEVSAMSKSAYLTFNAELDRFSELERGREMAMVLPLLLAPHAKNRLEVTLCEA